MNPLCAPKLLGAMSCKHTLFSLAFLREGNLIEWQKDVLQFPRLVPSQDGQGVSAAENIVAYTHSWFSLEENAMSVQLSQVTTFGHSGSF